MFLLDHYPNGSSAVDDTSVTYVTANESSQPSKVRQVNNHAFVVVYCFFVWKGWIYKVNSFEYSNNEFV